MMKRAFDLLVVVLSLPLVLPVAGILAALVRWKIGQPVLFRQQRPGLYGRPFFLYKFRTMSNLTDRNGTLLPDSERLLPFGKWLRSTSLDELPTLWNVLCGDMSLVGPRPLLMAYLERYSSDQMRRHNVPPGITGWAQVNGRNALSWNEKFDLDLWYIDHHSFLLDLKILAMTLFKVVRREGISQPGQATMEEFMGEGRNKRDE